MKRRRIALVFEQSQSNATLSYQHGWPKAFLNSVLFDCKPINLAGKSLADEAAIALYFHRERFDAIVLLHSVFSNQRNLRRLSSLSLSMCRTPKVFFIGNEYKLMPEKIRFCRHLGIDLLISQSNDSRVLSMYRRALSCCVDSVPNTGFDALKFQPQKALKDRRIDVGYRAFEAPLYLGNNEKAEIADLFILNAQKYGLSIDISFDPEKRFDAHNFAIFLNDCRSQIGTEAGGDYFELTDEIRKKINAYIISNPSSTWVEIKSKFFDDMPKIVPMRIISGRHVEAAACKTVQILYEGTYSGYFERDEHYICLKKDSTNLPDVVEKLRDDSYCEKITSNAYDVVMAELTYEKLIEKFAASLNNIL